MLQVCEYACASFKAPEQIQLFQTGHGGKTPMEWADPHTGMGKLGEVWTRVLLRAIAACAELPSVSLTCYARQWGNYTAIQMYCMKLNRNVAVWIPGQDLPILCINDSSSDGQLLDNIVRAIASQMQGHPLQVCECTGLFQRQPLRRH